MSLSALRHVRSVRCLTSLSRAAQDFDHRPCSRTPELQFLTRLAPLNSVFNVVKVLPNDIYRAFTMAVDEASSGNPSDPVHHEKVAAESLHQVKLTIMRRGDGSSSNTALTIRASCRHASTFFVVLDSLSTMKNTT